MIVHLLSIQLSRISRRSIRSLVFAAAAFAAVPFAVAPAGATQLTAFRQAVAETAAQDRDIAAFYRSNGFEPIWTGPGEADRARRSALLSAMADAPMHGLPRARHDPERLLGLLASVRSARERALAEVEMSKAFVRLVRDMQSGLVDPSFIDRGIKRKGIYRDAQSYLAAFAASERPRGYFRKLIPQTREYARLMKLKMRLETLIRTGGWGPEVPAQALEKGQSGPAVVALRDRLMRMGYLERSATAVYDEEIAAAVRSFQEAHGLEPDGKAGPATMAEINRSPGERLRSVLVAMERERWNNQDRGKRHILVNITDFSARIIDNDRITFETRAVVGAAAADRRTPEFSDEMEYMVINPTWNVPRSIAVKEYLPQLRANPGAVSHLRLYDGSGREVNRAGIDFSAYNASNFPFDLKQPPSKGNALGLVKFMFPNPYNIYLHDTPAKNLFLSARRAYSHGCVRLARPFEFAYALLAPQVDDPKAYFHEILATGRETQVDLEQKVPVHIIYRTAFTNARGEPQYRADVYDRDARIWQALAAAGVTSEALEMADLPPVELAPLPEEEHVAPAPVGVAYEPQPALLAARPVFDSYRVITPRSTARSTARSDSGARNRQRRADR